RAGKPIQRDRRLGLGRAPGEGVRSKPILRGGRRAIRGLTARLGFSAAFSERGSAGEQEVLVRCDDPTPRSNRNSYDVTPSLDRLGQSAANNAWPGMPSANPPDWFVRRAGLALASRGKGSYQVSA